MDITECKKLLNEQLKIADKQLKDIEELTASLRKLLAIITDKED